MHHGCMYAVYVEDPVVGPVSDRDTLTQSPAPTLECSRAFALRSSCPWTGQLGSWVPPRPPVSPAVLPTVLLSPALVTTVL